jgi:type IV pilus assembly protein PilM
MSSNIVGIDIGSSSLRAMELKNTGGKPLVVRYHEVSLPEGSVRRGEVLEPKAVAAAMKLLWSKGRFSSKNVVLGLGGPRVMARELTVPKASLLHIREALPFTVQSSLPIPAANALLDFYPISEGLTDLGPVVNGLLVAAVKEAVEVNVEATLRAGLRPVRVDLIPFALARAILPVDQSPGMKALVSIGANTTNIVITVDGVPQLVRIISSGGDDVTRAIVARFSLDWEKAEQLKRSLGLLPSSSHGSVVEVIGATMQPLFSSIRDTLNYFVKGKSGAILDEIMITGGGRHLPGLQPALADATGRVVAEAELYERVRLGRGVSEITDQGRRGVMTTAFGLALGELK